jgi:hypothetical protein
MPKSTSNSKRNTSGQGPVGRAPASRAPVKAAVKPTGPKNPGGNAGNQGRAQSGGGPNVNKYARITPVTGSAQTRKTNPATAGDFGKAIGNHVMDGRNGGTITRKDPPLHVPTKAATPMGNAKALDVGRGGPGTGRTVHASGSQSTYGAPANQQGTINRDGTIASPGSNQGKPLDRSTSSSPFLNNAAGGQGPGSFGFKGPRS